jgi:hypothetical protein
MKKILASFVSVLVVSSLSTVVLAANAVISRTDKSTKQVILSEEAPAPVPEPAPAPEPGLKKFPFQSEL